MGKTLITILAVFISTAAFACPPELLSALKSHREYMAQGENRIKDSTPELPEGIVPSQGFDIAEHNCHEMAGQAYKIYMEPSCDMEPGGQKAIARYPFAINFRRANSVEELYKEKWQPGTDGIWTVTFELTAEGWKPTGQREELDFGKKPKHPADKPKE